MPRTITVRCPAWKAVDLGRPHRWAMQDGGHYCVYCLTEITFRQALVYNEDVARGLPEITLP